MTKDGWRVADSDMHVMEPPDLWERYIDPAYAHAAPRGLSEIPRDMRVRVKNHVVLRLGATRPSHVDGRKTGWQKQHDTVYAASEARGWDAQSQVDAMDAEGLDLAPEYRFLNGWSRYQVERLLGSGGMGTVYKAFDPTLGRYVALKFLHRNDDDHTQRFLREARAQARIAHPHVCQVHEVGEVEGRPYIAMQYIDGRSLGDLCEELTVETKVRLIRDVARAVHAAHRNGLIHRDLKPGNILMAREESGALHPFVVDFGLAQEQDEVALSRTGMISGTPAYISPEQAQGRPLDKRTDVYSLGVVLYELLAGFPPFKGSNLARILVQLVQEDAKPLRQIDPAIPEDLETLVAKCLEKDPARRYSSAQALADDLHHFAPGTSAVVMMMSTSRACSANSAISAAMNSLLISLA
jgi:serine/threonine protein kinase